MTPRTRAEKIAGLEGAVVGMSLDRKELTYAVALRGGITWLVHEAELEATGRHDRPEMHLDRFTDRPGRGRPDGRHSPSGYRSPTIGEDGRGGLGLRRRSRDRPGGVFPSGQP